MNQEQLTAWAASTDARLARTRSQTSRKPAEKKHVRLRTGAPDEVYDLVTGRPKKMPGRAAVEKRIRRTLKALGPEHVTGLELSRALDLAELCDVPNTHTHWSSVHRMLCVTGNNNCLDYCIAAPIIVL